jgi:hypothetical protein
MADALAVLCWNRRPTGRCRHPQARAAAADPTGELDPDQGGVVDGRGRGEGQAQPLVDLRQRAAGALEFEQQAVDDEVGVGGDAAPANVGPATQSSGRVRARRATRGPWAAFWS